MQSSHFKSHRLEIPRFPQKETEKEQEQIGIINIFDTGSCGGCSIISSSPYTEARHQKIAKICPLLNMFQVTFSLLYIY